MGCGEELPFVSAIVGGLFPGRAIVVSGMVLQSFASDTKRFVDSRRPTSLPRLYTSFHFKSQQSIGVLNYFSEPFRFYIDLCCGLLIQGDHMDNKALHFNPRFDSGGGW
ncbi:unnamed protein product [Strongylus vulgaris]|uniref:Galectin domain-containing protein n=1 Tax=Strongylus vulgaris TaxID=40348 RepID=A0A3P7JD70_STRVU|nr:unnamed protein product [Strongylus vulgaris]